MAVISLIPNILPLMFTAGIMGYFGIAIKPSTLLVFSIAFGISVDNAIHFLAKYGQELQSTRKDIAKSVLIAMNEVGVSIIYTGIILFFGFGIFFASKFGGTQALGILIAITIFLAVFANLLLLPSLLLSRGKMISKKDKMVVN
jgi:predicted RND superfamily exporter protein